MEKFKHNPTDTIVVNSPFGNRIHPITKKTEFHTGVDIAPKVRRVDGDNLYAVDDGRVIISKVNNGGVKAGYGYYTVIQHKNFATLYAHMQKLKMKTGDMVKAGDVIGFMGTTGTSTGTHLHFEVIEGQYASKKYLDPAQFFIQPDTEYSEAYEVVKAKAQLQADTMQYLKDYKHGRELIISLAKAMK